MAVRNITPPNPVLNTTVSSSTPVQSTPFSLEYIANPQVAYVVTVGAGLTATFQIMVSDDGVNYYNSGQVLPSVSGSATTFIAQYSGAFPWVLFQVTQSAGSGTVLVEGFAKGSA